MDESGLITATEAAARLGVKRQTLYAYVSRGLLFRQVAMDGRTSLFDPAEIDALRLGKRDRGEGELRAVISTAITKVSDEALLIRGEDVPALVEAGGGFENLVDVVWNVATASGWPAPDDGLRTELEGLDGLRSIVACASASDPMRFDLSPASVQLAGRRMIVGMAHGLPAQAAGGDTTLVAALWRRLTPRRASPAKRRALDVALALLIDHGLAASTFAARMAASVRADPYSVVTAGLGVMGGQLHGAASGRVHELLDDVERTGDAALAVGEILRSSDRLPGYGHSVYTQQDPRYGPLMRHIVEAWSTDPRLEHIYALRDVVGDRRDDFPNMDMALGSLTWLAGMHARAGETIFAIARTAGWLAHAAEEYGEAALRFRPQARYTGR